MDNTNQNSGINFLDQTTSGQPSPGVDTPVNTSSQPGANIIPATAVAQPSPIATPEPNIIQATPQTPLAPIVGQSASIEPSVTPVVPIITPVQTSVLDPINPMPSSQSFSQINVEPPPSASFGTITPNSISGAAGQMPINASVNPANFAGATTVQPQFTSMPQPTVVKPGQYAATQKIQVKPKNGMPWGIFLLSVVLVIAGTGYYVLFYRTGATFNLQNLQTTVQNQIGNLLGNQKAPEKVNLPEFNSSEEGQAAALNTKPIEEDPELDVLTPGTKPADITVDLDKTDLNKMDSLMQEIQ